MILFIKFKDKIKYYFIINGYLHMMKTIEGYTYKINEYIGKGYSSTVHKGINDKTGEQVSIKVIEMAKLEDPINQMLLQHEITALKKLSFSSGVLHLYDVYATKNNTYIVTELCEGDLGNLLKKRKNIPYHEAVDIIKQIINGYLDVYSVGYLHRDIKPANIFYKGNTYKIGDFGFAIPKKQLQQHKNYNVGSPVYMPPEALKDNIYSVSCDTWAIGIIFYQIIKGVVPWRAISQQKLYQKILAEPLDQLVQGLPEVAKSFLSRVLSLDPKMRMTIDQMATWPSKLAAVEIMGMGIASCSPLKQMKNHNNLVIVNNEPKIILTPKQIPNSFRFHPLPPPPPPTQKHIHHHSSHQYFSRPTSYPNPISINFPTEGQNKSVKAIPIQSQQKSIQEVTKYATSMLNYLKFLHRLIKFASPPCVVELPDLLNSLVSHLLHELDIYIEYVEIPAICVLDKWQNFLTSEKGTAFKTQLSQDKRKYKMFHIENDNLLRDLKQEMIKDGIAKLAMNLDQPQGKQKSIIALDYLTSFYQIWHLKKKHSFKDFLTVSKIDLIVEGNPYNVTVNHLPQIKRKLILIDVLD